MVEKIKPQKSARAETPQAASNLVDLIMERPKMRIKRPRSRQIMTARCNTSPDLYLNEYPKQMTNKQTLVTKISASKKKIKMPLSNLVVFT